MSKGFLVVAENNNDINFIRMAYALALSLSRTQSQNVKLSIITTEINNDDEKYTSAFDHVIVMDKDDSWKEKSKSLDTTSLCAKYYEVTPYDETIVLDADIIFTEDIIEWWNTFSNYELLFTTNVKTFRGDEIKSDFYRKVFTENDLPNIYTGLFYFKKCELSSIFFNFVNVIFENWELFFEKFLKVEHRPSFLSADVAYALAYKLLDLPIYDLNIPTFVHMKTKLQEIENLKLGEEWTNHLPVFLNRELHLKVNNYRQLLPFHYHDKNFLTEDIITSYESF